MTPRSACNQALIDAGLPLLPEPTGVRYTPSERRYLAESVTTGVEYDEWRYERRAVAMAAVHRRRETAQAAD